MGAHGAVRFRVRVRVRVTGNGPTEGMPVSSAARQRGSSSGLGTVTKGTPLRMVLSRHGVQLKFVSGNVKRTPWQPGTAPGGVRLPQLCGAIRLVSVWCSELLPGMCRCFGQAYQCDGGQVTPAHTKWQANPASECTTGRRCARGSRALAPPELGAGDWRSTVSHRAQLSVEPRCSAVQRSVPLQPSTA
eukprot:357141-Chlamydomonas_euryale.AAC.6